jgi:hypothetical protein
MWIIDLGYFTKMAKYSMYIIFQNLQYYHSTKKSKKRALIIIFVEIRNMIGLVHFSKPTVRTNMHLYSHQFGKPSEELVHPRT